MRFTVTWMESADDELAQIWLEAGDRKAITNAAHQLEALLRTDAHCRGKPCDGDRMIRIDPLLVFFSVSFEDRRVEILSVDLV